jgi:hypothetical protein
VIAGIFLINRPHTKFFTLKTNKER